MTTNSRRRGRRSLAAIAAALLMASVLAVVAGSPAQAANTSSEALFDHDNDASTPSVREFGGRDRYDTALRLANNFGKAKGLDGIPVAFVASGYKLVDAVSVSGLAGFFDAPILLTPSDSLHGGVADFIEDYGIDTIHILGGSGAVSDGVAEAIEALANEPTVNRIQGADRYETAANAASQLGGGAAWCGGEAAAAILANGGDVSLVDAMMVGPIAHHLQLPLLLTAADELPMATADFIEAEDIEHVVIVGNAGAVSDDVATALSDAGVDTVQRIGRGSAGATSVALAGLLTGDCKDDLSSTSGDTVALVSMDGLPDGVAAAPVLASTYADQDLVPMLIVGDTLPASVRDYLAATSEVDAAGAKLNLSIVAIGGGAAVSEGVMSAAVEAAASADALTVAIGNGGSVETTAAAADAAVDVNKDGKTNAADAPQVGHNRIRLYFSDNVAGDNTDTATVDELENAIRDILEINGAPARLAGDQTGDSVSDPPTLDSPVHHGTGESAACDPDVVTVTLASPLKAGDTISVVGGSKLGANDDQRTVGPTSVTVAAPAPDRTRPTVSVILIAGEQDGYVTLSEDDETLSASDVTVRLGSASAQSLIDAGGQIDADGNIELASGSSFAADDRVTIAAGAVENDAENKSLQRSFTTIAAPKSPRITSVIMSNLNHSDQASIAVPISLTGGNGTASLGTVADATEDMWIDAKSDGAAAGAVGNDWSITFDRASTYDADKDLDIDVRVNSRDRAVFVRFNNGAAKFSDLKAALEANSAFDALFEVRIDAEATTLADGACGKAADFALAINAANDETGAAGLVRGATVSTVSLTGGMTKVAIRVTFNGYISAHDDTQLLDDVLAATLARAIKDEADLDDDEDTIDLAELRTALALDALGTGETNEDNVAATYPGTRVTYSATTSHDGLLPQVRDLVVTSAVADVDDSDTTDVNETDSVATGYADNEASPSADDGENVDVNKNGPSSVRIGRSSAVDAPK